MGRSFVRPMGFSREGRMVPSVARESTLHCKPDSQLHWAAVRSIFWVGGKWIMEIPDEGKLRILPTARVGKMLFDQFSEPESLVEFTPV
jgi:hypothetical protein